MFFSFIDFVDCLRQSLNLVKLDKCPHSFHYILHIEFLNIAKTSSFVFQKAESFHKRVLSSSLFSQLKYYFFPHVSLQQIVLFPTCHDAFVVSQDLHKLVPCICKRFEVSINHLDKTLNILLMLF